jgi:hypothetical protein
MKRLLRAAHPARLIERREMAMARARDRLEQFRTDLDRHMERCRVSGCREPFDRETRTAISDTLTLLRH